MGELLDRTSSHELSEWQAFYKLEPFGARAYYLGHAITAQIIANVNRNKGQKAYKTEDFIPDFDQDPQTPEAMLEFAKAMTASMGGEIRIPDNGG